MYVLRCSGTVCTESTLTDSCQVPSPTPLGALRAAHDLTTTRQPNFPSMHFLNEADRKYHCYTEKSTLNIFDLVIYQQDIAQRFSRTWLQLHTLKVNGWMLE